MSIRLSDKELNELPDELLSELRIENYQNEQSLIESIIEFNGGTASLDQLLILIYKNTGEIKRRDKLNAKLYRMYKKGIIKKVKDTKSLYEICK